jgi:hypothetical protein
MKEPKGVAVFGDPSGMVDSTRASCNQTLSHEDSEEIGKVIKLV